MNSNQPGKQIKSALAETLNSFPHEDCLTCECFLGFLTQLELDAGQESRPYFSQFQPDRALIHSCLGCDPCPPGNEYAKYIRAKRK